MKERPRAHTQGRYIFRGELEEYDERFLVCRDTGHRWIPNPHWDITRKGKRILEFHRAVRCETCGCERRDTYDSNMQIISRYYKHNPGYVIGKETEIRLTAATSRMEQVRRAHLLPERAARRQLRAV